MVETLHIIGGDIAGGSLMKSGLPDEGTLNARAVFLEDATAGGLDRRRVLETLHNQYRKLAEAAADRHI